MEWVKIYILLLLAGFFPLELLAQSVEEIRQNPDFLWGTGNAPTLKKADNDALAALVSQISTKVSASFEQLTEGKNRNDKTTAEETFKSVIQTYSRATLNNTRRIVIQNEPEAVVMRYIKVAEIQRIFEGRKHKLLNFAREAQQAEKNAQVADALRYYYWSLVLLQSYPDGNYLTLKDEAGKEQLLATWLPKQMNDIFSHITLSVERIHTDGNLKTVYIKALYKGIPVRNYDYTYFDGRDWSNLFSAKDGRGIIELPTLANADGLPVKTEYAFEGEANIDNELLDVMETVNLPVMRNAYLKLEGDSLAEQTGNAGVSPAGAMKMDADESVAVLKPKEAASYFATVQRVEKAVRLQDFTGLDSLFTTTGLDMFNRLIRYGHAKIIRTPQYRFWKCGDEVACRTLPMSFSFEGNRRTFVEDVVFYLNRDARICGLSFSLNEPAVKDIMDRTAWKAPVKSVLIRFLEDYKTAYALKRSDYINSIFSDDALIVTGSVLKRSAMGEMQPVDKQFVKFTRQTKQEYMKKLQYIFDSNEFINLRFADNQIRKSGVGNEVYGIQIKQEYFSSSYGDTGYLFLMVDLNNPREPLIHVRTWQPERDPNFGLIDLSYF